MDSPRLDNYKNMGLFLIRSDSPSLVDQINKKCLCCDSPAIIRGMCMDCFWSNTELIEINEICDK